MPRPDDEKSWSLQDTSEAFVAEALESAKVELVPSVQRAAQSEPGVNWRAVDDVMADERARMLAHSRMSNMSRGC